MKWESTAQCMKCDSRFTPGPEMNSYCPPCEREFQRLLKQDLGDAYEVTTGRKDPLQ